MIYNNIYKYGYKHNGSSYHLLPFRFKNIDNSTVCIVNDLGEYLFLTPNQLKDLVKKKLDSKENLYKELRVKQFIVDDESQGLLDSYIIKYRTKKGFLDGFTKLHMIVPTLRCNHSCPYCQVSRVSEDKEKYDMDLGTAKNTADLILRCPSKYITVEFQGGEPLLNFSIIKYIVEYIEGRKEESGKSIDYVVCTNLSMLTSEILEFLKKYKIDVSSSLDGQESLHNENRPKPENDSYELFLKNLQKARDALGIHHVAVLMTTTRKSLSYPKEIVDEYIKLGFKSIVLRPLNPYGFALKTQKHIGYTIEEFMVFYKSVFEYILQLNKNGIDFQESFAKMILRKILTPYPIGFVDNQSPAGAGVGAVLYNYDVFNNRKI